MLNFIHNLVAKIGKSGALAAIFFILFAMQLIGTTAVLFIAGYPVLAAANAIMSILLLLFWIDIRTRQ